MLSHLFLFALNVRDDIYDKIQMVIEKLHRIHWIFDALQIKCIYLCQPKMSRMDINGHGRPEFWRFNGNRQRFHRLHILNLIENIMKPSIHVVPKRDPMATLNRLKTSIWILLMSVYDVLLISQMFSFFFAFNKYTRLLFLFLSLFFDLANCVP